MGELITLNTKRVNRGINIILLLLFALFFYTLGRQGSQIEYQTIVEYVPIEKVVEKVVEKIDRAVSKNAISKYEKGEMLPDSSILIKLANALSVKVDYFFRTTKIQLNAAEYRKKKSKLSKKTQVSIVNDMIKKLKNIKSEL